MSEGRGPGAGTPTPASDDELRHELVAANHVLAALGVVDGWGHVSVRSVEDDHRFLLARSMAPALVTARDVLDLEVSTGEPVEQARSYLERHIHAAVYRARPDVRSVVHCHSPALIPFGVTGVPLRPVVHVSAFLAQGAPVFEIRDAGPGVGMLVDDPDLGDAMAKALGTAPLVLLRGHGATVVGDSIKQAVYRAHYAGENAELQRQATALGPVRFLSTDESLAASEVVDRSVDRTWDLWRRSVAAGGGAPGGDGR